MVQDSSLNSVSLTATRPGSEIHNSEFHPQLLTNLCRPGDLVTSNSGKHMQQEVWKDIAKSLTAKVPEVNDLASMPA